jgi:hypothetical protein
MDNDRTKIHWRSLHASAFHLTLCLFYPIETKNRQKTLILQQVHHRHDHLFVINDVLSISIVSRLYINDPI